MPLSPAQLRDHACLADELLRDFAQHQGMIPLDVDRFWQAQDQCVRDAFSPDNTQCPLGMLMSGECIYDELGIPEDYWRYETDPRWRQQMHKAYNEQAVKIVGRKLLDESYADPARRYTGVKTLAEVFEMKAQWHAGSWWLEPSVQNADELRQLLDRVDRIELEKFLLPADWHEQKARLLPLGIQPPRYLHQRGPVTFATSLIGCESLLFLLMDEPELAERLRDTMLRVMLAMRRLLDREAGYTELNAPPGFSFADDNCALLTPELYEFFGYPILKGMFDAFAPAPHHSRHQHSDSAMGHLLPLLGQLKLTSTNFGPTVSVEAIRQHIPGAVIFGELAPFTLSRCDHRGLILEFLRDFELTRSTRGLCFATAGSINNGSRLTAMRLLMATIQRLGRYE